MSIVKIVAPAGTRLKVTTIAPKTVTQDIPEVRGPGGELLAAAQKKEFQVMAGVSGHTFEGGETAETFEFDLAPGNKLMVEEADKVAGPARVVPPAPPAADPAQQEAPATPAVGDNPAAAPVVTA